MTVDQAYETADIAKETFGEEYTVNLLYLFSTGDYTVELMNRTTGQIIRI